jgi:hypothetical protein
VLSYRSTAAPDPPVEDESGVGTRIELAYGGGPFTEAADLTWTDETENLDGRDVVTWRRGDDAPFPAPQPGEASFSLISTTRRYDSAHATGPLYGQLLPRVPCRITRYLAGIPYRRFFGFVRAFPLEDADAGASGQVTRIEADDAFTILQTIAAPRSEHELRVLQDDPLGYWPLDDSEGGYTRDTGRFDFFGELPHGLTSSPVAEFGGDGGVVGAYADSALAGVAGTATHTHPDGDVDIAAIEFIADLGVNEFPDYSGSGTESYTTRVVQIQSGLASWVARIVRTYSEAPLTGHFAEVTRLQMYWADGSTTRAAENIEIGRIPFFDVATQSASLDRLKSTAAGREAVRAWKAFRESERITRNLEVWAWVEASTGRDASGTLDLARQQKRTTEQAHRDAAAAIKQAQAARILAVSNTAALANLDVARDDTSRPVHIVGRVTSGPTLQVWVDGELVASSTTTGDPGGAGVLSNSVRIRLAPRGVPVGHVAAYDHDLDPQSILEHYVSARAGIGPQRTGERARMVLAAAHWPTSFSDVDNGHSYITGPPTGSTLSYLQQLAEAEQTRIFVAGDGKVTFRGRMWDVTATEATVAQATLVGHEGDPAERFAAVHRSPASAETIINDVMVVRDGGIAQRRTIPITQRQGGTFTRGYAGLPLNSDAAAGYFAAYIVDRYSTPQDRIDQLVIDAAFDSAYWLPIVSTLDLGHRVLAELHPQQVGAVLEQDATIEAVEEQFTLDGSLHTVALHLVPAQESAIDAPWALVGTTLFDGETPIHF